jgi:hypothetical protein
MTKPLWESLEGLVRRPGWMRPSSTGCLEGDAADERMPLPIEEEGLYLLWRGAVATCRRASDQTMLLPSSALEDRVFKPEDMLVVAHPDGSEIHATCRGLVDAPYHALRVPLYLLVQGWAACAGAGYGAEAILYVAGVQDALLRSRSPIHHQATGFGEQVRSAVRSLLGAVEYAWVALWLIAADEELEQTASSFLKQLAASASDLHTFMSRHRGTQTFGEVQRAWTAGCVASDPTWVGSEDEAFNNACWDICEALLPVAQREAHAPTAVAWATYQAHSPGVVFVRCCLDSIIMLSASYHNMRGRRNKVEGLALVAAVSHAEIGLVECMDSVERTLEALSTPSASGAAPPLPPRPHTAGEPLSEYPKRLKGLLKARCRDFMDTLYAPVRLADSFPIGGWLIARQLLLTQLVPEMPCGIGAVPPGKRSLGYLEGLPAALDAVDAPSDAAREMVDAVMLPSSTDELLF